MEDPHINDSEASAFEYREAIKKYKLGFSAGAALVLYMILYFFFPLPDELTKQVIRPWPLFDANGWQLEVRRALASALISYALFSAVLQVLFYKSTERQLAEALPRVIASNVSFLSSFSNLQQRQFVRNTLNSLLGNSIGQSTFEYIKPMLREDAGFRKSFEYDVILDDFPPERVNDEVKSVFKSENYRWVDETLTYKLVNPTKAADERYPRGPFKVVFLFDKTSLETLNRDQSIFARFLIELEPEALDWLFNSSDEDAKRKFISVIAPSLNERISHSGDENPLEGSISLEKPLLSIKNKAKPFFKFEMSHPLRSSPGESQLVLNFCHPYRREATHFIFTHPQPVFSPKITFDFNRAPSMFDVDYSSYYSIAKPEIFRSKPPGKGTNRFDFSVEDAWVFPTSGITMVWKNQKTLRVTDMTSSIEKRHIVPCRHRGAEKRIYVVWKGDGDGGSELELAMKQFGETGYDANAEPSEHFRKIEEHLRRSGFEPFLA